MVGKLTSWGSVWLRDANVCCSGGDYGGGDGGGGDMGGGDF